MERRIRFRDVTTVLDTVEYPVERGAAAEAVSDVMLVLADGEAPLGELIADTKAETFESPADIESELHNVLPRGAVGEPFQSEGDA